MTAATTPSSSLPYDSSIYNPTHRERLLSHYRRRKNEDAKKSKVIISFFKELMLLRAPQKPRQRDVRRTIATQFGMWDYSEEPRMTFTLPSESAFMCGPKEKAKHNL